MKKVFSVLAVLLLCFSMPVRASASTVPFGLVQPYYEKASDAKSMLFIDGATAKCESSVKGNSDVVEITPYKLSKSRAFCGSGVHTTTQRGQNR